MPVRPLVALACAAVLLVACGSSSSPQGGSSTATTAASTSSSTSSASSASSSGVTIAITVSGGKVQGGVQTNDVPLGSTVTLTVTSDVSDEVHVHGYDKKADVTAGSYATIAFTADIPGQFEVELENAHLKIVELKVS